MTGDETDGPAMGRGHRRHGSFGNLLRRFSTAVRSNRAPSNSRQPSAPASSREPTHQSTLPSRPAVVSNVLSDSALPQINDAVVEDVIQEHAEEKDETHAAARPLTIARTRTAPVQPRSAPTYSSPGTVRIRRSCHMCGNVFIRTERICQDCEHVLCSRCPRDPPKLQRLPSAPPGEDLHSEAMPVPDEVMMSDVPIDEDPAAEPNISLDAIKRTSLYQPQFDSPPRHQHREREWKKPRHRIRYICDQCSTPFSEKSRVCQRDGCGHRRCENCPREPPKRLKSGEHDPEVVRKLEARLATYVVMQSAAAAATTAAVEATAEAAVTTTATTDATVAMDVSDPPDTSATTGSKAEIPVAGIT